MKNIMGNRIKDPLRYIVVHTPTPIDYITTISYALKYAYIWSSGSTNINIGYWFKEKIDTCINIYNDRMYYGHYRYFSSGGDEISNIREFYHKIKFIRAYNNII